MKQRKLTKHSIKRAKQRLHWKRKTLERYFTLATQFGWFDNDTNTYEYENIFYVVARNHKKITLLTVYAKN